MGFSIGIDATNIKTGGGLTHLYEILCELDPSKFGIERVVIWGSTSTLAKIEDRDWLIKRNSWWLNSNLMIRSIWQRFRLSSVARLESVDVLFIPGGSYGGNFSPVVSMSQNLLPFDLMEIRRYGFSLFAVKLLLLRWIQSRTFKNSDGVIFLTNFTRKVVLNAVGKWNSQTVIIPHGVNPRFYSEPRLQLPIQNYDDKNPYRLLYVSTIDEYKHQSKVVDAVAVLREQGIPVSLDLVGSSSSVALHRLNITLDRVDPNRNWVRFHNEVSYNELHHVYERADLGIFASSCENQPIILIETMASGLPIACSNRGVMPEVLRDAGVYFDPECSEEIVKALRSLIFSPTLRAKLAHDSYNLSQQYSWKLCTDETFAFITNIVSQKRV